VQESKRDECGKMGGHGHYFAGHAGWKRQEEQSNGNEEVQNKILKKGKEKKRKRSEKGEKCNKRGRIGANCREIE